MKVYCLDYNSKPDFRDQAEIVPYVSLSDFAGYDNTGTDSQDDVFADAFIMAVSLNVGLYIPPGRYRTTAQLTIPSNLHVFGAGMNSVIVADGTFRIFVMDSVEGCLVENFKIEGIGTTVATGQSGIRFADATHCIARNITINHVRLNGLEASGSQNCYTENIRILSPLTFGVFWFDCVDCADYDTYIYRPGSFAYEFKSSKRCISTNLDIIEPQAEYGVYFWTGTGTGPETVGPQLCEDCGVVNLYVKGMTDSKHLVYVNASRRCWIRGARLEPGAGQSWATVAINGTFFYNEGSAMAAQFTSGSAAFDNLTDPDEQLEIGSSIHIEGSATNHIIATIDHETGTGTLTANADVTGGHVIGFVASPDDTTLDDVYIIGADDPTSTPDAIDIGGTSVNPLKNIRFSNLKIENAAYVGMNVNYADVWINGGKFRRSKGLVEINIQNVSTVIASMVDFESNLTGSYGVKATLATSTFVGYGCDFTNFRIAGASPSVDGAIIRLYGGKIENVLELPVGLYSNSTCQDVTFRNNMVGLGSFNGQIRLFGDNNTVNGNIFEPPLVPIGLGANEAAIDSHIKEQTGAGNTTANVIGINAYGGGLTNNVLLASGSKSVRYGPDGVIFPGLTKAQRDALNPQNGWMLYQTDNTPGIRAYENGAWVKFTATADP